MLTKAIPRFGLHLKTINGLKIPRTPKQIDTIAEIIFS